MRAHPGGNCIDQVMVSCRRGSRIRTERERERERVRQRVEIDSDRFSAERRGGVELGSTFSLAGRAPSPVPTNDMQAVVDQLQATHHNNAKC